MKPLTPKHKEENSIPVSQMKDGDVGIITSWTSDFIGMIVQRYGECLISLEVIQGNPPQINHGDDFWNPIPSSVACQVKILQKGDI